MTQELFGINGELYIALRGFTIWYYEDTYNKNIPRKYVRKQINKNDILLFVGIKNNLIEFICDRDHLIDFVCIENHSMIYNTFIEKLR